MLLVDKLPTIAASSICSGLKQSPWYIIPPYSAQPQKKRASPINQLWDAPLCHMAPARVMDNAAQ